MTTNRDLRMFPGLAALFEAAAQDFVQQATAAVQSRGRFTVALSGGSTPKGLFQVLSTKDQDRLPWGQMFFFWGDERHVPPDNPDSNFRMASETLLSKVPVPAANIFRVPAEDPDAEEAAARYESTLRDFFALAPGQLPQFDLIHLGMGPDGHTASLFPHTKALQEKHRLVVANWVEKFSTFRITMTASVLNAARAVEFLVAGADKATALHEVLEGHESAEKYPSKMIDPVDGKLVWMVDQAAARGLTAVRS
jgi:6-phosphogluconolactonase